MVITPQSRRGILMKRKLKPKFLSLAFLSVLLFIGCIYIKLYIFNYSNYGSISLWYPKWACGNCPDMLVIGSADTQLSQYIGENVYLRVSGEFWDKKYIYDSRYGDNKYKLYCTGKFKKSIKMKLYEMDSIFDIFDTKGILFDATNCIPVRVTSMDNELIDSLIDSNKF